MRMSHLFRGLILGGLAASAAGPLPGPAATVPSVVEANTAFALDLYSGLKAGDGNLFFSPYSISTCLAMTYTGARGQTEKQMARVLHFDAPAAKINASFGELQRQVTAGANRSGMELRIANGLWAQAGKPFLPEFLDPVQRGYQARLERVDFKTGAEAARLAINSWVAGQTENRIPDLLPPGSLLANTRLVLANAIYFKGVWAKPFEKAGTSPQPFFLAAGGQVLAPLMHHADEVRYLENDRFQAVELPYSGGQLSLVVLLPREHNGYAGLERELTPAFLSQSLAPMRNQRVEIFLPRFKMQFGAELKGVLSRLGMPDAFSPDSDFSGMDATHLLYISEVFHKAWVELNEEGTEAAAATGVVVATRAMVQRPREVPVFRADHPFVFLIRDTQSGSVLFLGRLTNPTN